MPNPKLALYHYDGCPYCMLVRGAVERLGTDLELRNVLEDGGHLRELVEATGRRTVPCLRIEEGDGSARWMHESRDIIHFCERLAA